MIYVEFSDICGAVQKFHCIMKCKCRMETFVISLSIAFTLSPYSYYFVCFFLSSCRVCNLRVSVGMHIFILYMLIWDFSVFFFYLFLFAVLVFWMRVSLHCFNSFAIQIVAAVFVVFGCNLFMRSFFYYYYFQHKIHQHINDCI